MTRSFRSPLSSWGQARSSEHLSGAGRRDSPLPALSGGDPSEREQLPGVSETSQIRTRRGGKPRAELFRAQPRGRRPASGRRPALGIFGPRLGQERQGRRGRASGRQRRRVGARRTALIHVLRRRIRPWGRQGDDARYGCLAGEHQPRDRRRRGAAGLSIRAKRNATRHAADDGRNAAGGASRPGPAYRSVGAERTATSGVGLGSERNTAWRSFGPKRNSAAPLKAAPLSY